MNNPNLTANIVKKTLMAVTEADVELKDDQFQGTWSIDRYVQAEVRMFPLRFTDEAGVEHKISYIHVIARISPSGELTVSGYDLHSDWGVCVWKHEMAGLKVAAGASKRDVMRVAIEGLLPGYRLHEQDTFRPVQASGRTGKLADHLAVRSAMKAVIDAKTAAIGEMAPGDDPENPPRRRR